MEQPNSSGAPRVADPDRWRPGKFKAKAVDWGVSKTNAGLPQVVILFEYLQQNQEGVTESRQLMWFGSFKGGARERTLETLVNLGLRSPVSTMEQGRNGAALDPDKEVEIVVEHRIGQDGMRRAGISWVNELGGRGVKSNIADGEAQALFSDVDSEFMATLIAKGLPVIHKGSGNGQTVAQQAQMQGMFNEADIPF